MELDANEADFMRSGGTQLQEILPATPGLVWRKRYKEVRRIILEHALEDDFNSQVVEFMAARLKPGQGLYKLQEDCAFLDTQGEFPMCTIYDNPNRPNICHDFKEDSFGCHDIRADAGLETQVKIKSRPDYVR